MSQVTASNMEMPTEGGATRPIGLWVVIVLSALMVLRTFALTRIPKGIISNRNQNPCFQPPRMLSLVCKLH